MPTSVMGAQRQRADLADEPSWALRQAVVCLTLIALCFDQAPGLVVPDTKLDLVVSPWRFLGRALQMWDPQSSGGVVQNQANGYLWPVGPFFGVLHSLGLPAWVVQRSWWSVIVVLAFLGTVRLARALGVGTDMSRLIAGVAFALSPRMLSSLGPISVEVLPMALAPWAVLPLVRAGGTRSLRRAAALSAVVILCMGGVNASATFGGMLPAAVFVVLGPLAGSRLRLAGWWGLAVALATAWWVVPLLLLGRYAAPFLPYTETSTVTTSVTSLVEVLRGTSHWVPYLYSPEGPLRPAGWELLTSGPLVLASGLVVACGLAGLATRRGPDRAWLVGSLLLGVLMVGAGHVGALDSPLSVPLRHALEGVLSPLRNVHKFDPLVRLPLMLGLAHLLASLRWRRDPALTPVVRRLAAGAAALAVLVGVLPAVTGHLPAGRPFARVPVVWTSVARALAQNASAGRALLLPGSPFAQYDWGDPVDEPLQPLADSPWEVRDGSPLIPAGHIRLLDAIDQQLRSGRPSNGLAAVLARSGISHVVVRGDLRPSTMAVPVDVVTQVLRGSPGLSLVHSLGMPSDGEPEPRAAPVQIYRVDTPVEPVSATPLSQVTLLSGGPESLLPAVEDGLLDARPTVLAAQVPPGLASGPSVLTDGLQRREQDFASARHQLSPVLGRDDPLVYERPAREFTLGSARDETVAELLGADAVRASSSLADPDAGVLWSPSHLPYAAFDGDPSTSWTAGVRPTGPVGQWLELDVGRSVAPALVRVTWGPGSVVREVRLDTDQGSLEHVVVAGVGTEDLQVPVGPLRRLRLTVTATDPAAPSGQVSISELEVPGERVIRSLVMPPLPGGATPDAIALHASRTGQDACVASGSAVRCDASRVVGGDEDGGLVRRFDVGEGGGYDGELVALPRAGRPLDALLDTQSPAVRVLATSRAVDDPRGGPAAALDGDSGTGWVASPGDGSPGLVFGWLQARTVQSLRLVVDPSLGAAAPTRVRVHAGAQAYEADVAADGSVRFPALHTAQLAIDFLTWRQPTASSRASVGVSEVEVPGLVGLAVPDAGTPVLLTCGSTPSLAVDGRHVMTTGSTTVGDLRALRPVRLHACGSAPAPIELSGEVRLLAVSTPALRVDRVDLRRRGALPPVDEQVPVRRLSWGAEHRAVEVAARSSDVLLTVRDNANAGWVALVDGHALASVPVDGWQQGWVVPAGNATVVELTYRPGRAYRVALAVGAVGVLVLGLLAALPGRARRTSRKGRAVPTWVAGLALATAFVLLAGLAGLIAWAAAAGVAVASRRRLPTAGPWLAGSAYGAGTLLLAVHPWGGKDYAAGSRLVTILCLTGLAMATACWSPRGAEVASLDAQAASD